MIKNIVSLLALAVVCTACASSETQQPTKKEIGIQLYSVRADMKKNPADTIAKVGAIGYTAVEAAGYGNGKFYGMTPQVFKSKCEAAGMKVLSSHSRIQLTKDELASGDFSKSLAKWDALIAAHKAAGMKYIVDPYLGVPATLKDLDTICKYFNEVGKKCNAAGLSFGYHNHSHEFRKVEGQTMFDYMIQHTDPANVFFEMDVYWVMRGNADAVAYFEKYPNRFRLLHIKDELEIGQSKKVDFDKIFKNIEKSGCEYIIVEVERYSKNKTPLESVKESWQWLDANKNLKACQKPAGK